MKKFKAPLPMIVGLSALLMAPAVYAQQTAIPGYDEAVAKAAEMDWDTDESIRGGLELVAQFDSSGPDAWDVEKHPLVYVTSESHQNYNTDRLLDGSYAGFHLVDAYTKEVITDVIVNHHETGNRIARGPHGMVVSPDGKWAYVGWNEQDGSITRTSGYIAVVNMRTLKLDKLLRQESHYRGAPRSQAPHHIMACATEDGTQRVIAQFGFGASGGPHFVLDPDDDNRVARAINYDDVQTMGHPFVSPSRDCNTAYISIGSAEHRQNYVPTAGVAKLDLNTGIVNNVMGTGYHPIGITHSYDDKHTYVIDGQGSYVYKIDNDSNSVIAWTSAGVGGPYGVAMNWDESLLFSVGKGEGTHNVGMNLGVVDAERFAPFRGKMQMPIHLGGSASSVDHAILHPDPEVNELWVSSMNGWETIIVDLNTLEVKDYVATPYGGDTHSGAFVRYEADWSGELMADQGGPRSHNMIAKVEEHVLARLAPEEEEHVPATPEQIAMGKELFETKAADHGCAPCHSMDAGGAIGPDIRGIGYSLLNEALNGVVPQMDFIADDISEEERRAIGAYLSTLSK